MDEKTTVEAPGLVWVKDPVNRVTGVPNGDVPKSRHHDDCMHWYRDASGGLLGPAPYRASEKQMRELPPCQTCATSVGAGRSAARREVVHGGPCPSCGMGLPLTGVCDDCG